MRKLTCPLLVFTNLTKVRSLTRVVLVFARSSQGLLDKSRFLFPCNHGLEPVKVIALSSSNLFAQFLCPRGIVPFLHDRSLLQGLFQGFLTRLTRYLDDKIGQCKPFERNHLTSDTGYWFRSVYKCFIFIQYIDDGRDFATVRSVIY